MDTDARGMLATVEDTPAQWERALDLIGEVDRWQVVDRPRAVIVAGMGGSGIVADVARVLADAAGTAPVVPLKGYRLPAWAADDTPLIAVSYSGGTEETLEIMRSAGARGVPITVVSSGGRLTELADELEAPALAVPSGLQPRAALAYLAAPTLVALERTGVLPGISDELGPLGDELREHRRGWGDEPRRVAAGLADRVPVFVGGHGVGALVALRARCQVNENAEMPAFSSELPELDHNEVVGWGGGPRTPYGLVELRDPQDDHERVTARFEVTREVTARVLDRVATHELDGSTRLARLASGIHWVDLVSVQLALATGVDPTPVERIDRLKQALAAS